MNRHLVIAMVLVATCLEVRAMSENPDKEHQVSTNTKCPDTPAPPAAEHCCKRFPCTFEKVRKEVCAIHLGAGTIDKWATFPNMACLNRTICEDNKWSFCHKGVCRNENVRCDEEDRLVNLSIKE